MSTFRGATVLVLAALGIGEALAEHPNDALAGQLASAESDAARLDLLREAIVHADPSKRSALVAVGGLVGALPKDAGLEVWEAYVEAVSSEDRSARAYALAAAKFGGHLDPAGAPLLSTEAARGLYATSRLAIGPMWIAGCVQDTVINTGESKFIGGTMVEGRWSARAPERGDRFGVRPRAERDERVAAQCGAGETSWFHGVTWGVWVGGRPEPRPDALGTASEYLSPPECKARKVAVSISSSGTARATATFPLLLSDCYAVESVHRAVLVHNNKLARDLHLEPESISDLNVSPATVRGWPECEDPAVRNEGVCGI